MNGKPETYVFMSLSNFAINNKLLIKRVCMPKPQTIGTFINKIFARKESHEIDVDKEN